MHATVVVGVVGEVMVDIDTYYGSRWIKNHFAPQRCMLYMLTLVCPLLIPFCIAYSYVLYLYHVADTFKNICMIILIPGGKTAPRSFQSHI